jgi:uncharacterized protein
VAEKLGRPVDALLGEGAALVRQQQSLREEVGAFTFDDIVQELQKPGRDPRDEFVPFQFREDIHALKDLKPGMSCPGIVTNVTNFGAFVDIGVHQDGLVHVSQLTDRFVKDPAEVVFPGKRVVVRVLEVNLDKGQIALTMKSEAPKRPPRPAQKPRRAPEGKPRPSRPSAKPEPPRRPPAATPPVSSAPKPGAPPAKPGPRPPARPPQRPRDTAHSSPPHKVPLNNPFAALAELKKTLKSRE